MKRLPILALVFSLTLLFAPDMRAGVAAEEMAEAATNFLATLKPEEVKKVMFPLKGEERFDWHYVPKNRPGLAIKEMNKAQRDAVHVLLDAALSQKGFVKTTTIISLETVLHELENRNPTRDAGLYHISIFGKPKADGTWGWRFEGHHLSLNFTVVDGELISGTPSFLGANPAEVKEGPRKGTRPLGPEEDIGRQLVKALDEDQQKEAIVSKDAPREILTRADRKAKNLEPKGLSFAEMNREQAGLLIQLIKEYLGRYREEIAGDDWKRIQKAGLENVYFAWAGGLEPGQGHYYRVQGPTFLLEYDNTQNKANHIHAVWRDLENDFGEDFLRKHLAEEHGAEGK